MAKKEFKAGLYGVAAAVLVAVVLVGLTVFAFTSRYNAFSPEKVAQSYADTIVQTGDGYNALKVSLVSKEQKFGNFVTNAYMTPYINDGKDVKQNEIIIVVISIFFAKLKEVRAAVLQDDYMDTDFMFSVFESNVQTYADKLTGTKEKLAADKKTVIQKASTGIYQELYGKDYKLTTAVTDTKELPADEVEAYATGYKNRVVPIAQNNEALANTLDDEKSSAMKEAFDNLNVADSIEAVDECTVEVTNQNGDVVANTKVYVVKIGNSWYVDNSNTDTASLYLVK